MDVDVVDWIAGRNHAIEVSLELVQRLGLHSIRGSLCLHKASLVESRICLLPRANPDRPKVPHCAVHRLAAVLLGQRRLAVLLNLMDVLQLLME